MTRKSSDLQDLLLNLLPKDGSTLGNKTALRQLHEAGVRLSEEDYRHTRDCLLAAGLVIKGKGRGGSIAKAAATSGGLENSPSELVLEMQSVPEELPLGQQPSKGGRRKVSKGQTKSKGEQAQVLAYRYDDKRKNNPQVGMVDTHSDGVEEKKTWRYDPHLDPELLFDSSSRRYQVEVLIDEALAASAADAEQTQTELLDWLDHALAGDNEAAVREVVTNLRKRIAGRKPDVGISAPLEELKRLQSPYLQWAGKAERTSFEVDTVSLHVHERIDPATILAAVQKRIRDSKGKSAPAFQSDLFHAPFENLPLREAIDFYKHDRDWANRLIAGDSLLVMNSLVQKESMAGQVQMIYIDPPYGIKYGSNFQPFTNKRDVKDRSDQDLTQEPEMIKAFRDTWELGVHSYLTYLRDRLLMARELLSETGSVFVQISDENLHHVRELMDEIFGPNNFQAVIGYQTTTGKASSTLDVTFDFVVWYSKSENFKYHPVYMQRSAGDDQNLRWILWENGHKQSFSKLKDIEEAIAKGGRLFRPNPLTSQSGSDTTMFEYQFQGTSFSPSKGGWKTNILGMGRLFNASRLMASGRTLCFNRFLHDFPVKPFNNLWSDTRQSGFSDPKTYVVQTAVKVIERCLLMTTDPGDLVLDPTCGSGTTAYAAEKLGRRWITCDTSRVATTLAKQRLMTASYDYYELKYPQEGLRGGFVYKTVPHIMLKSIATNPEIDEIYERMHPAIEEALKRLNAALKGQKITYKVTGGGRKGGLVNFAAPDSQIMDLPSGESILVNALLEWEVPFEIPEDWPKVALSPFEAFHTARQAMQQQMDDSIAAHAGQEVLYDQPAISKSKLRITGPFTVEAVPFATVLGLDEAEQPKEADVAVARSGATSRHAQWRDELIKAGIRGKGGQKLKLVDLEPLPGTHYISAVGTVAETGDRVAISFGPEHAALEQRQVEIAMREAGELFPLPKLLLFCAFTFDPEAAKDIDNIKGIQALKAQMNTDLLTEDLKKGRANNESFWLMGQPEVEVHTLNDGKLKVEVHGFDYFDTKTGELKSGGKKNIAMWALDTDYDNRSLYPRQIFFPMAGSKDGWYKLKKDIRAELNEDLLDSFHGTQSLPFEPGDNRCVAVKIVDDRGIESLKVIRLD